jgi:hypothetical protein
MLNAVRVLMHPKRDGTSAHKEDVSLLPVSFAPGPGRVLCCGAPVDEAMLMARWCRHRQEPKPIRSAPIPPLQLPSATAGSGTLRFPRRPRPATHTPTIRCGRICSLALDGAILARLHRSLLCAVCMTCQCRRQFDRLRLPIWAGVTTCPADSQTRPLMENYQVGARTGTLLQAHAISFRYFIPVAPAAARECPSARVPRQSRMVRLGHLAAYTICLPKYR